MKQPPSSLQHLQLVVLAVAAIILVMPTGARAAPPHAEEPRCMDTRISFPRANDTLSGVVVVTGRAQLVGAFVRYQVDFSTTGRDLWVMLNGAPQAVIDGPLARWDTSLLPDGLYDLRVRTIDTSGNYCEGYARSITIKTGAIGAQANAALTVSNTIDIPTFGGMLFVTIPQVPSIAYCTPSSSVGSFVTRSIRLCAGHTYRPFTVVGNNISIVGDTARTAVIRSIGRTYGITMRGNGGLIAGVRVEGSTAPADAGNWLCLYEQCTLGTTPVTGGTAYGGGILLEGGETTVMNSDVTGGVIGIASLQGRGNKFLNNNLFNLTGWGIFAIAPSNSSFVGNMLHDINRACKDPGGTFYPGGCESAGMLLMGADTNLIAYNTCARGGNCYYLNGEGGRLNNFNKLYGNSCADPSYNCFEITDADGIEFDGNSASLAPDNASGCEIWLVRANVLAGLNNRVNLCNHHGSRSESTYEKIK